MAAVGAGPPGVVNAAGALGVANDRKQRNPSAQKETQMERLQRIRQGVYGACGGTPWPSGVGLSAMVCFF